MEAQFEFNNFKINFIRMLIKKKLLVDYGCFVKFGSLLLLAAKAATSCPKIFVFFFQNSFEMRLFLSE